MLLYSALLLIGFLMLFKSADQFVIGSVTTAKNFHISPMLIGLTVVALGTSAPEIFVAAAASLRGEPPWWRGLGVGDDALVAACEVLLRAAAAAGGSELRCERRWRVPAEHG